MARTKRKPTKEHMSATERDAEASVPDEARQHAEYARRAHGERDRDGGVMDGHHLRRLACARGLESLVKPNVNRRVPFLAQHHMDAASDYQSDLEASQGSYSHELRPFVNRSSQVQAFNQRRLDAAKRIGLINMRMNPTQRVMVDLVVQYHPDKLLSQIFPNAKRAKMSKIKDNLKDGLQWLAVEYNHSTNYNREVDKRHE